MVVFFQVHCISTEFTPRKHGGEKGVPFRIQVDTFKQTENGEYTDHLHSASCQIKVFKVTVENRSLISLSETVVKLGGHLYITAWLLRSDFKYKTVFHLLSCSCNCSFLAKRSRQEAENRQRKDGKANCTWKRKVSAFLWHHSSYRGNKIIAFAHWGEDT